MHKKKLTKLPFRLKRQIRLLMKQKLRKLQPMLSLPMLFLQWKLQLRLLTAWNQSKFRSLKLSDPHQKIASKLPQHVSFYLRVRKRITNGTMLQR